MPISEYKVDRDKFEPEENAHLAFPCYACKNRHGTDCDEPCRHCDWNVGAVPDDVP